MKRNRYRTDRSTASGKRPAWLHNRVILTALGAIGCMYVGASWLASSGTPAQASVQTEPLQLPQVADSVAQPQWLAGIATLGETPSSDSPTPLNHALVGTSTGRLAGTLANGLGDDDWQVVTVKRGQTLGSIFASLDLSPSVVHNVVHVDEHTKKLTRIYPGDDLLFQLADDGALSALQYRLDETTTLQVHHGDSGYSSSLLEDELLRDTAHASGVITSSLFVDGQQAGLSDGMIMEMANLFGWDIDFVLDLRQGDSFHVVFEKIYRNGDFIRNGNILAATFVNQGEKYRAIRYENDQGFADYYSPDGRNMKKAFLRAPVNFSAVTSSFNPRRKHPVTGRVSAHRGVDYRAPVGTAVVAVGDGTVTRSAYNKLNGHHVFLRHPNGIVTKYLHFKKRAVKSGSKVRQGQTIGYLGSTGRVTGPHLHYEFVVNGVHRNPRTVKLPAAKPLPKAQLPAFQAAAAPLLAWLDNLEQTQLAQLD